MTTEGDNWPQCAASAPRLHHLLTKDPSCSQEEPEKKLDRANTMISLIKHKYEPVYQQLRISTVDYSRRLCNSCCARRVQEVTDKGCF